MRDETTEDAGKLNRRDAIKRTLAVGGAVYVAPMIVGAVKPVFAQGVSDSHPECVGATCDTFIECSSSNPDCICVQTSTGTGICVPGSTSCNVVGDCGSAPDYSCPSGSICVVNTCCMDGPVCAPIALAAECPAGVPATRTPRTRSHPGTIGG